MICTRRPKEYDVGDEMPLLNHQFRVTGIVEHGKGARLFLDIDEAQEMIGAVDNGLAVFRQVGGPGDDLRTPSTGSKPCSRHTQRDHYERWSL